MVIYFTLVNLLNYIDRYLASGILPLIMRDLNLTNAQGGALVSAFVIGYTVFAPIFGYLGDRYNRVHIMAFGVLMWSFATILTGVSDLIWVFFLSRVLVGIGEASFGTISPGYLKDRIPDPAKLSMSLAIFFSAIPAGSALGYVFGGFIADRISWHAAFLICGAPGIVMALLLLKFPEKRVEKITNVNFRAGIRQIVRIPLVVVAVLGYALNAFALNGVAAFISKYGETIGFQNREITVYFGIILVVAGFAGTIGGGKIITTRALKTSDPSDALLRYIGVVSLVATPLLAAAFLVQDHMIFLALCFFAELLIFSTVAPVNAVIVQAAPPQLVTLTQGTTILAINLLGSLPAPWLVGTVSDHYGVPLGMQVSSVGLLLSGILWWKGTACLRSMRKA